MLKELGVAEQVDAPDSNPGAERRGSSTLPSETHSFYTDGTKNCSVCKQQKPILEFSKDGVFSTGETKRKSRCKKCYSENRVRGTPRKVVLNEDGEPAYDPRARELVDSERFRVWLRAQPLTLERLAADAHPQPRNPRSLRHALNQKSVSLELVDSIVMGQGLMLWQIGY